MLTKYNDNPCLYNIIIHTLPAFKADCFSNKEIKKSYNIADLQLQKLSWKHILNV